ncbi:hypothetical protein EDD28_0966 [Salana multivorans]|uniref:Homeodomain-like domain-containing protein n=1 Tax=Salana multivorans TaxID=120377 RepID=A0A3N2D9E0_9MICO|nr:hypothetical protein [Salana multivorans]MBN8883828.1 hypothetical protein [Salana multivorans]ROR96383.1 hypothetical protein EDD28_0966 [Salana multivorans]
MQSQQAKRLEKVADAISAIKDPLVRLAAAREARERFEQLELEQVKRLRREGATWSKIGALYGLTKQGAQQRFKSRIDAT